VFALGKLPVLQNSWNSSESRLIGLPLMKVFCLWIYKHARYHQYPRKRKNPLCRQGRQDHVSRRFSFDKPYKLLIKSWHGKGDALQPNKHLDTDVKRPPRTAFFQRQNVGKEDYL